MALHKNARTTPASRAELVRRVLREGQSVVAVAAALDVHAATVRKWIERFEAQGPEGLEDRSSRPLRLRSPTPSETVEQILALHRAGRTGQQIARKVGVSGMTVSRIVRAAGSTDARNGSQPPTENSVRPR
jgi:transposase-like protein